jgi:hypothetical protein
MKNHPTSQRILAQAVVLLAGCFIACGGTPKPPQRGAANLVPQFVPVEIPQSTFVIPSQPSEGRNPFFPQSNNGFQAAPIARHKETGAPDASAFVLNGITSPPRRTAMINGRTFEPGESGEVRLPNGSKALIKCEQIGNESAVILVNGQRREVRFRSGV